MWMYYESVKSEVNSISPQSNMSEAHLKTKADSLTAGCYSSNRRPVFTERLGTYTNTALSINTRLV